MFEYGICTLEDLKMAATGGHFPRQNCFIGLYPQAMRLDAETNSKLSEIILRSFANHNRTFKRTSWARTIRFDNEALEALRPSLIAHPAHVVQDLGASDARNSCDFFAAYATVIGTSPEFFATDLCFTVTVLRRRNARTRVVIDQQGHILQVVLPPFVLPARTGIRRSVQQPINVLLRFVLFNTSVKRTLRLYKKRDPSIDKTMISLVCSEAEHLALHTPTFHLERHNVLDKASRTYTTVRALNLLNRAYFSDAQLLRAITNVLSSLSEGGAFIVGSNGDSGSTVDGAAYLKSEGRFHRIFSSGSGCKIDPLILEASVC
jgi:hypothetical protein